MDPNDISTLIVAATPVVLAILALAHLVVVARLARAKAKAAESNRSKRVKIAAPKPSS